MACDVAAASELLCGASALTCPVRLFSTELCKASLALSPETIKKHCSPTANELYELWDAVTGDRHELVLFDVSPLVDVLDETLIPTVPIRCDLSGGVFALNQTTHSNIVAPPTVPRKTQGFLGFRADHALRLLAFLFENHIADF